MLWLLKTIYGLKQAARAIWTRLLIAFTEMSFKRNAADPCLYYNWTEFGLIIWISWIDDLLIVGNKQGVLKYKEEMMTKFECDEVGELQKYVGCKVEWNKNEKWLMLEILIKPRAAIYKPVPRRANF